MTQLLALADALGIDASYTSWRGTPATASDVTLRALVTALAPAHGLAAACVDAPAPAIAALVAARWATPLEPVVVAWADGEGPFEVDVALRLPADVDGVVRATVTGEVGAPVTTHTTRFALHADGHAWPDGRVHCVRHLRFAVASAGYYTLAVELDGVAHAALLIVAPRRAYVAPRGPALGVFAPAYALRDARSGAAGDLRTLAALATRAHAAGVTVLGTLPLLAGFLDEPFEPSPYAAASRTAWNELYLDLDAAAAAIGVPAPATSAPAAALATSDLIDYRAQMAWRRAALDALAAAAWAQPALATTLRAFAATGTFGPYAHFRALGEAHRRAWASWPPEAQASARDAGAWRAALDGDDALHAARMRTHLFAQWAMDAQLATFTARTNVGLYLDLPVGVGADAFDVCWQPELFVTGASTGAPPDALFVGGQDWGLPPLHPTKIRQARWAPVIAAVRHHMQHATMLRVDHVMGLHRLYWVPRGQPATDGAYVRYAADEVWAILCLESHRHRCEVIGEDLGTVPPAVPAAMAQHGVRGLTVRQFTLPTRPGAPRAAVPATTVASLGTHDTPTFAGFARGDDLTILHELGLLTDAALAAARAARAATLAATRHELGLPASADDAALVRALHLQLAASPARDVLITLEDLWLEPRPQNVPGTGPERPNWRRPCATSLDALLAAPWWVELDALAQRRPRR